MTTTVYVSIGNSDDKLTQAEWVDFWDTVHTILAFADQMHGSWHSVSIDPWQNACWCVVFENELAMKIAKEHLARLCTTYRQDSITWAVAEVEFLKADGQ